MLLRILVGGVGVGLVWMVADTKEITKKLYGLDKSALKVFRGYENQ